MTQNRNRKIDKQKEVQFKLFLRFLKQNNLMDCLYGKDNKHYYKNIKKVCEHPWTSLYDYLYLLNGQLGLRFSFNGRNNLLRKWNAVATNYKKIKKSKYTVYGK